jgi:hypothetical protein
MGNRRRLGGAIRRKIYAMNLPNCHESCTRTCALTESGICDAIKTASADELIDYLEARGFGWSLDHISRMVESRIWEWPNIVGRYRPATRESLADMLRGAMRTMGKSRLTRPPKRPA